MDDDKTSSLRRSHHEREALCTTRPKYRDGRALKAVKVYTVSSESQYLLIRGVSVIQGAFEDLVARLKTFGETVEERVLADYPLEPSEKFTKVVLVKFSKIQSARVAKNKLDDLNLLGEVLHVCYAPEFESMEETRAKLEERRRAVKWRLERLGGRASKANATSETSTNSDQSSCQQVAQNEPNCAKSDANFFGNHHARAASTAFPNIDQPSAYQLMYAPGHTYSAYSNNVHQSNYAKDWKEAASATDQFHPNPSNLHQNLNRSSGHSFNSSSKKSIGGLHRSSILSRKNLSGDNNPMPIPNLRPRQVHKAILNQGVNAALRKNALALRDEVQGPQLPEHVERKRKTFHCSETGDESLDKSHQVIREKMARLDSDCQEKF